MAGRRSQGERACCGEQADVTCPGLTVRRLSEERVHELADEIWRASTGRPAPPRPSLNPRRGRPGASAQAAYRRRRQQDRAAWRPGWRRRTAMAAVTVATPRQLGHLLHHASPHLPSDVERATDWLLQMLRPAGGGPRPQGPAAGRRLGHQAAAGRSLRAPARCSPVQGFGHGGRRHARRLCLLSVAEWNHWDDRRKAGGRG
jgi:hypothetical protein